MPTSSNITVTFSEPVTAGTGAFALACTTSGTVPLTVTPGGPSTTFVLDPESDLQQNETCTVTVESTAVSDVDEVDPPDNMGADFTFSFSTTGLALRIHEIQGTAHLSPYDGDLVSQVPGVVTAVTTNGFWYQDPQPDVERRHVGGHLRLHRLGAGRGRGRLGHRQRPRAGVPARLHPELPADQRAPSRT